MKQAAQEVIDALNARDADRAALFENHERDATIRILQDGGACPTCGAWHDEQIIKQPDHNEQHLKMVEQLAQQEPVAWVNANSFQGLTLGHYAYVEIYTDESAGRIPLYTRFQARDGVAVCEHCENERSVIHAPAREPLTDEEIEQLEQDTCAMDFPETVRAIEAAHGIKGDA